jgi:hypothetical protein
MAINHLHSTSDVLSSGVEHDNYRLESPTGMKYLANEKWK